MTVFILYILKKTHLTLDTKIYLASKNKDLIFLLPKLNKKGYIKNILLSLGFPLHASVTSLLEATYLHLTTGINTWKWFLEKAV